MAVRWRWAERDFGFRFRKGGKGRADHYQANLQDEFYVVPPEQCKLDPENLKRLAVQGQVPAAARVVANPWSNYELGWDWITSVDRLCLNYAGCLDRDEIKAREEEGNSRAYDRVRLLVESEIPTPLSVALIRELHRDFMGEIYPFAGEWRTVGLHKGDGPERWPLPKQGIQPFMDVYERDVLCRSPFVSDDDDAVFRFASEVMNELIAIHPFREGNGRTAFFLGDIILLQNGFLSIGLYNRHRHEQRYLAACEAGRLAKDYGPLAALLADWEDEAIADWGATDAT